MAKKILILEDSSQSAYGGGQKISKIVIESIAAKHQVFLSDYDNSSLFFNDVKSHLRGFICLKLRKGKSTYTQRLFQGLFFIKNVSALKRFVNQNQIELLYAATKLNLLTAYVLKKILKVPYIYHAHMAPEDNQGSKLIINFLKSANITLAVSKYVRQQILKKDDKVKVAVLYNPIEYRLGNFKKIVGKDQFNVAFFGSIKYEKGIEPLLKAAKICVNSTLDITFNIYGSGEILELIKSSAPPNVVFKGHINDVEDELENNVDVLILPSVIPEACPTIILQAMTKGLPIITTDIGGQCELVVDGINGYQVPIKSAEAISKAVFALLGSPTTYEEISKNNLRDIIQKPNLESFGNSILKFIGF